MPTPGSGRDKYIVTIGDRGADLEVSPDASDSGIAVVEHTLPPGALGAPLHRHRHEDEVSSVLAGELTVRRGDEIATAGAGEYVVKVRDEWHTFWNAGTRPVRFLEIIAPGEMADYFREVAELLEHRSPEVDPMERNVETAETYGRDLQPESVPELARRHGLEV